MVKIVKKHCSNCISTALNAVKAVPRGTFALRIQTVTIVPSTTAHSKKITTLAFKNRVRETRLFLSKLFGGYTSVTGKGGYISDDKGRRLIVEDNAVVTCYAQTKNFAANKAKWFKWLREKRKLWQQQSMGIIIENDMFYIK